MVQKWQNILQYRCILTVFLTHLSICRFRVQYAALQKEEAEQNEFIEQFILNK